jgi:uncharacterized protein (TIGR00369 family)
MLERRAPSPPFSETTDIWMVSAKAGRVVFEAMPSARFYNPMGVIHGGWIATLLDSCMGCAVQSALKAAQTYTTVEMKTVFVRAAHEGTGLLRCEGTLLHSGRRIASSVPILSARTLITIEYLSPQRDSRSPSDASASPWDLARWPRLRLVGTRCYQPAPWV